jgi:phage baseplate assembly protein W
MPGKLEGISVSLPLVYSSSDGPYALNKNINQVMRQNLKNLILTSPGERVMDPNFGVGIRRFLFENISPVLYQQAQNKIFEQVQFYMPIINIRQILFLKNEDDPSIPLNAVSIMIEYDLGSIDGADRLQITETIT